MRRASPAPPTPPACPAPPPPLQVVPLPNRDALLPGRYPRFTMLAQAAASVAVAWQGLRQLVPELWIDTTGARWAAPPDTVLHLKGGADCLLAPFWPGSAQLLARTLPSLPAFSTSSECRQ